MTDSEETQLVDALSELLADWLTDHPQKAFRSVSEI